MTATINKSIDGGNSWNTVASPGGEINVGISFKDDSNGFYAGDEGDLHFTSDGGAIWTESLGRSILSAKNTGCSYIQ